MKSSGGGLSGEEGQVCEYLRWLSVGDDLDGHDGLDLRLK